MAIDYMVDIVTALFATKVQSDAAYQVPGTYGLNQNFDGKLRLTRATVVANGTGYAKNNVVTIAGGTSTTAATIQALEVNSAGGITRHKVVNPGVYTVLPANPVSVTGGAGTGATFTAFWQGNQQMRVMTFVEILRAYLNSVQDVQESKVLQEVLGQMLAQNRQGIGIGGAGWNASVRSSQAQRDGMNILAKTNVQY